MICWYSGLETVSCNLVEKFFQPILSAHTVNAYAAGENYIHAVDLVGVLLLCIFRTFL